MCFPHINPDTISGCSTAISPLAKALAGDIPRQEMEDNIPEMPNPDACDFVPVINKFDGPRNVNTDNISEFKSNGQTVSASRSI